MLFVFCSDFANILWYNQYLSMDTFIKVRGARQHNLKNVDLDIPKGKLVVFTGVSGSGKSSLAFDTIYAEGQRRYVESLSTYARQFLGVMEKPEVDSIEGLSPAISIDQKTTSRNPRSTVGTITETYDYLRLLYARVGHPHCPSCGREISNQSIDQMVTQALKLITETAKSGKKARFFVLSPLVVDKKGEFISLFENIKAKGYKKVRIDGVIKNISDDFVLIKTNKHTIEVVIDTLIVASSSLKDELYLSNLKARLTDSFEQSLKLSAGQVILAQILDASFEMPEYPKEFTNHLFSEKFACPVDNISIPDIEPRTFSFNSPHGACPNCHGIGRILKTNPDTVFAMDLSISEGAIIPFASMFEYDTWFSRLIATFCKENAIDTKVALKRLKESDRKLLLEGTGARTYKVDGTNRFGKPTQIVESFPGILSEIEKRYKEVNSEHVKAELGKYMREKICPQCLGARLKKEALGVTIDDKSIAEVTTLSIFDTDTWLKGLVERNVFSVQEKTIAELILKEIADRLGFLKSVGLEYLTLDRSATTLSGGEAQRIRLASQIGSGLTGVLYVLDEPTIGLHQRDNERLITTLKKLRDLGNTVIVVEHDEQTIKDSDYVFDFGPGAGSLGGEVIARGTYKEILGNPNSLTGQYLSGKKKVEAHIPKQDFLLDSRFAKNESETPGVITVYGCRQFNLKGIDVALPCGKLVAITGVSGSGKSSFLVDTLYPALQEKLNSRFRGEVGIHSRITGVDNVDKVILIDQSPIGRTPRSNPATYTKVFDPIRDVYSATREAKAAGYKKGRFSFNVKGGRCENCEGQGQIKIEMQFMSDLWITCEVCKGTRYNSQTLEVTFRGKNIAEVLDMTVTDAREFFHAHPTISGKLETLDDVGLGYMRLGQSATTLSGGEAQRVKLATELARKDTGRTVYILDEPTTGLHFADIQRLLTVLKILVARGNSVFLIEHNLDIIKSADHIIDLGPEGGDGGGAIVAQGGVADIIANKASHTGRFLAH